MERGEINEIRRKVIQLKAVSQQQQKFTNLLLIYCLITILSIQPAQAACSYNDNCYQKCLNKYCEYDPSTNSFYNSSITNTASNYSGQGCCSGCSDPYSQDHYFDAANSNCIQRSCGIDSNGEQLYWQFRSDGCLPFLNCTRQVGYINRANGFCQSRCRNGYFADNDKKECVTSCQTGYYKKQTPIHNSQLGNQCVNSQNCISSGRFVNNITGFCEQTCTNGLFGDAGYCVSECTSSYANGVKYFRQKRYWRCVDNCYIFNRQFYDNNTGYCEPQCSNNLKGNVQDGLCVEACGSNQYLLKSMNICVGKCQLYANQSSTPNALFRDSFSKTCVQQHSCSFNSYDKIQTYSFNFSCVDMCSDDKRYGHPETKKCEKSCFGKYPYRNIVLRTCTSTADGANYLQTSATTVSDQNMVVISKTAAILIFFGLIFSFLLVIGGVLFYKYYLKKKLYHQCKQMTARKNMDQSS